MESKKFIIVTGILYLSSLLSYYSQIKIIDLYGLQVKYYFDLNLSYLQIALTLAMFGLPSAISLTVSREKKIPRGLKKYSIICAIISSCVLNFFFLNGSFLIFSGLFLFLYISLFNDLNTGVMSSIQMFEYPRFWQLIGNITLLSFIIVGPFFIESKLTDEVYALIFILIPIIPLFLAITFGKKYREMSSPYETTSLGHIFKYISYIYLFSITSIIMTKIPYINYSEFVDKYSLAQYTLSISLSNFIVIPLNLLTLKILSSEMKKKINIGLVNLFLIIFISLSALALFYISSTFTLLNQLTNISSASILTSTYIIIAITAISSINLSVSLREQKKIRCFVLLDVILIFILFFITRDSTLFFESLSSYNYLIAGSIFLKVLFQIYLLRERNVYNNNCKL